MQLRRHGHADQLHRQRQLRRRQRRRPVQLRQHGHADQLHRQRQLRRSTAAACRTAYGTTTLTNCTVSGNSATANGGGGWHLRHDHADQLHRQRQLRAADGGGIWNAYGGTTTLTNCTVSGNSASGNGGGLFNDATAARPR